MPTIHLIHNSTAGKGHSKEDLLPLLESFGYHCSYSTCIELGGDEWPEEIDFIVIAGGDGTIKSAIKVLLDRKLLYKTKPIAVLPIGTANNFSKSLGLTGCREEIIRSWETASIKKMDVGRIYNYPKNEFFIESIGFGIFPSFIEIMKRAKPAKSPEESVKNSVIGFHRMSILSKAQECTLLLDGVDYSGHYLMVEVMNIPSIGPNLTLSPQADPSDGWLEVLLVQEKERKDLLRYLEYKMEGEEQDCQLRSIKAKEVVVSWPRKEAHIDDTLVVLPENQPLALGIREGILDYLKPSKRRE